MLWFGCCHSILNRVRYMYIETCTYIQLQSFTTAATRPLPDGQSRCGRRSLGQCWECWGRDPTGLGGFDMMISWMASLVQPSGVAAVGREARCCSTCWEWLFHMQALRPSKCETFLGWKAGGSILLIDVKLCQQDLWWFVNFSTGRSWCGLSFHKVQTIGELHDQWLSDTERRMMPLLQAQAGCGFDHLTELNWSRDLPGTQATQMATQKSLAQARALIGGEAQRKIFAENPKAHGLWWSWSWL